MEKKLIEKNIKKATELFKKSLEDLFLKTNKDFYGVSFQSYINKLGGKISINRKNNGDLRISGVLIKQHFKEDIKGLPRGVEDWRIYPLVVNLFMVDE